MTNDESNLTKNDNKNISYDDAKYAKIGKLCGDNLVAAIANDKRCCIDNEIRNLDIKNKEIKKNNFKKKSNLHKNTKIKNQNKNVNKTESIIYLYRICVRPIFYQLLFKKFTKKKTNMCRVIS